MKFKLLAILLIITCSLFSMNENLKNAIRKSRPDLVVKALKEENIDPNTMYQYKTFANIVLDRRIDKMHSTVNKHKTITKGSNIFYKGIGCTALGSLPFLLSRSSNDSIFSIGICGMFYVSIPSFIFAYKYFKQYSKIYNDAKNKIRTYKQAYFDAVEVQQLLKNL